MPNRRSLLATLAAAAVAAVVVGSLLGLRFGADPGRTPSTTSAPTTASTTAPTTAADGPAAPDAPAGSASHEAEHGPGTKHEGVDATPTTPTSSPTGSPTGSSGSSGTSVRGGVTVIPEHAGAAADYRLPDLRAATGDRTYEVPTESASARGRLVAGYPRALLPVAPGSAVVSSSVTSTDGRAQVALVAERTALPGALLRFYRAALTHAGFREVAVRAVGGADAVAFRLRADRVVVTVDADPARTYSVYATLVAPGA